MFRILFLTIALLLSACGSSNEPTPVPTPTPTPAVAFDPAKIDTPKIPTTFKTIKTSVIKDVAAWNALWALSTNQYVVPEVDFSKRMVVAMFWSQSTPCSGASHYINEVASTSTAVEVRYMDIPSPSTSTTCAQVVVDSSQGFSIPVTDKPINFVKIN